MRREISHGECVDNLIWEVGPHCGKYYQILVEEKWPQLHVCVSFLYGNREWPAPFSDIRAHNIIWNSHNYILSSKIYISSGVAVQLMSTAKPIPFTGQRSSSHSRRTVGIKKTSTCVVSGCDFLFYHCRRCSCLDASSTSRSTGA